MSVDVAIFEHPPGSGCRVLSIQSHVVSGYVGNKSATFPLQALGFDVDVLNSLQFGTHTGYGNVAGQRLGAGELLALIDNLEANGVLNYTHLLSGYIGKPDFLLAMKEVVVRLRKHNPDLVYVCDPVMGDNGRLYVPAELVAIYRDEIVPLATILTPNQFELEQLTGLSVATRAEALAAMNLLHARGVPTVVVTSHVTAEEERVINVIGSRVATERHAAVTFCLKVPVLDGYFTGTGDLFSALLLAWSHCLPDDLKGAVQRTLSTIRAALDRTARHAAGRSDPHSRELRLIQSLRDIMVPPAAVTFEEVAF